MNAPHDRGITPNERKALHRYVQASIDGARGLARDLRDAAGAHAKAARDSVHADARLHMDAAWWANKQADVVDAHADLTQKILDKAITTESPIAIAAAVASAAQTNAVVSDSTRAATDAGVGTTQPKPGSLPPPSPPPAAPSDDTSARDACRAQGGIWDGQHCTMPSDATPPPSPPAGGGSGILPLVLGGGALLVGAPAVVAVAVAIGVWALSKKAASPASGTQGLGGWSDDGTLDVEGLQALISLCEDEEGDGFLPYCQNTDGKYGPETRANLMAALKRAESLGGLKVADITGDIPDVQDDYSMEPVKDTDDWVASLMALATHKAPGHLSLDKLKDAINSVEYVCKAPSRGGGGGSKGSKTGKDKGGGGLFPVTLTPSKSTVTAVLIIAAVIGGAAYYANKKEPKRKAA